MRYGSLGMTIEIERTGKHGRRIGKRRAVRVTHERAREHRKLMQRGMVKLGVAGPEWERVRAFTMPVRPDRKVIR